MTLIGPGKALQANEAREPILSSIRSAFIIIACLFLPP